jgi:Ca2+/H+ antiporter
MHHTIQLSNKKLTTFLFPFTPSALEQVSQFALLGCAVVLVILIIAISFSIRNHRRKFTQFHDEDEVAAHSKTKKCSLAMIIFSAILALMFVLVCAVATTSALDSQSKVWHFVGELAFFLIFLFVL